MTSVAPAPPSRARVLWFYGADAVGKSTIGWAAYSALAQAAARVAYLDTDSLGFCHPSPPDPAELVAANLRAVWSVYEAAGIDHLVISGVMVSLEDRARFADALSGAHVTYCRLTATPATIRRRIVARREAEAATQGAVLTPSVRAELAEYGDRSVRFAQLLERLGLEDLTLRTDDRSPTELAREAVRRFWAGAPGGGAPGCVR